MIRRLGLIMTILVMIVPLTVFSAGERGSIRVRMRYEDVAVPGGAVALYALSDEDDTGDPQTLWERAETSGQSALVIPVGSDGEVIFENLEPGGYLLVQPKAAEGFLPIKPFCVRIPMHMNGEMMYHIDATPKIETKPETKLPQTGLLTWPAYFLLALGTAVAGAGILMSKRK